MFVRFVVGADAENAAWLNGIFTEAEILRSAGQLHDYEAKQIETAFEWFNENLSVPPFKKKLKAGEWTQEAVAWFRHDAKSAIERIWDIVAVLREHGDFVRMVTSEKPGKIVYEDDHQVVAETPYWA